MMRAEEIEAAFRSACADEIRALKPGNVHVHAAGHGMTAGDFLRSAAAASPALCAPGVSLGIRIFDAVQATRAAVGQNTNLGIVLLCAPLAMAAETACALQDGVRHAIAAAGVEDTAKIFAAIVLAAPGGLGDVACHDVRRPATVTPAVAMAEAAPRDRVARQYASGFADIFGCGLTAYRNALARWSDPLWAAAASYLEHMAAGPDSHILRELGSEAAAVVQHQAVAVKAKLFNCRDPNELVPELLAWDADLKRRGINPGTCADLTVATILAHLLQTDLPPPDGDG